MIFNTLPDVNFTTLNQVATYDVGDCDSFTAQFVATGWTGTLTFGASLDGTSFTPLAVESRTVAAAATRVLTVTAANMITLRTEGLKFFRITCTAFTAGSMRVLLSEGKD
jgi:hypothetical protein